MLASPALAEDPIVSRVVVWKPKPGMEAKLEAGIKAHNEFHRKQNDASAFETFVITSGPDSGAFVRVAGARNWKDFDAEALGDKADQADTALNTDPYIASATTGYWRVRLDMSHPRPVMTPPAMWAITFYRVKYDKTGDFERARKKIKEATDKANWPRNFLVLSLVSGGEGPTFAVLQARDKFADFNPPEGKTFAQMMEEQVGRDEAELVDRTIGGAVESTSTEIVNYRADLSYMPAKK
jgi:hypothetical protein